MRVKTFGVVVLMAIMFFPGVPARASGQPIDEIREEVRAFALENMAGSGVPGMVFVMVDSDGTLIAEPFGLADVATGRPMTIDTPLRVGSISKPITAAVGLELASTGVLDLDVPVESYLETDLSDRFGPASTVRQLLQHRGGYPDAVVGSHHLDPTDAVDLDDWVRRLPERSIAPDVVASYSSVGYTLAGAAMAGAAGSEFAEIARDLVFDPLDMSRTTFVQPAPAEVAIGYSSGPDGLNPYPIDVPDLVPGVGLTASGVDIGRFMTAVLAHDSPLSPMTRRALLEPAGPHPGLRSYTTGLTEWQYETRSVLYHEGNGIGTTSRITILPGEDVGLFTAVNGEALTGIGGASPQTTFVRELHEQLIDEFYTNPSTLETAPKLFGTGREIDPGTAVYVPTRVDPNTVLRLEALISQFEMDDDEEALFLEGPDGVTYATFGGTSSYREAAWWESMTANLIVIAGAVLSVAAGSLFGARRARGTSRWLAVLTGLLVLGFLTALGYGVSTVQVMDLFTGLTPSIRIAQMAIAAAFVSAVTLAVTTWLETRTGNGVVDGLIARASVVLGTVLLTIWSVAWGLLPL